MKERERERNGERKRERETHTHIRCKGMISDSECHGSALRHEFASDRLLRLFLQPVSGPEESTRRLSSCSGEACGDTTCPAIELVSCEVRERGDHEEELLLLCDGCEGVRHRHALA